MGFFNNLLSGASSSSPVSGRQDTAVNLSLGGAINKNVDPAGLDLKEIVVYGLLIFVVWKLVK